MPLWGIFFNINFQAETNTGLKHKLITTRGSLIAAIQRIFKNLFLWCFITGDPEHFFMLNFNKIMLESNSSIFHKPNLF